MFTKRDIDQLDRAYFKVINTTGYHLMLQSKNTKHYWDIECKELVFGIGYIVINHKHNDSDAFHVQKKCHPKSVKEAQTLIKEHDEYHLKERVEKRKERIKKKRELRISEK